MYDGHNSSRVATLEIFKGMSFLHFFPSTRAMLSKDMVPYIERPFVGSVVAIYNENETPVLEQNGRVVRILNIFRDEPMFIHTCIYFKMSR